MLANLLSAASAQAVKLNNFETLHGRMLWLAAKKRTGDYELRVNLTCDTYGIVHRSEVLPSEF
jgi:hypothetical protein